MFMLKQLRASCEAFLPIMVGWQRLKWLLLAIFLFFMLNRKMFIAFLMPFFFMVSKEQLIWFKDAAVRFCCRGLCPKKAKGFFRDLFTRNKVEKSKWILLVLFLYFMLNWYLFIGFLLALFFLLRWEQLKGFVKVCVGFGVIIVLHFYYVKDRKDNLEALKDEMKRLKNNKSRVQEQLDDQRQRENRCNKEMLDWFDKAEAIIRDMEAIETDFNQNKIWLNRWLPNYYLYCKFGKIAHEKLDAVSEHNKSFLLINHAESSSSSSYSMEIPTIGLDDQAELILNYLNDNHNPIIGVYGIGGIGKTTLVRHVHKTVKGFDQVLFVTVSNEPNLHVLQKCIAKELNPSFPEELTFGEEVAARIFHLLKDKKYLLVLDDIWGELDLVQLGIPNPTSDNGCKIILTTRSSRVCNMMEASVQIRVNSMCEATAMSLLSTKVGVVLLKSDIQTIAKEIIKECGGVPLAIVSISTTLRNKRSVEPWKEALKTVRASKGESLGMATVFKSLKMNYDCLDLRTKRLFLYCSLFPKDHDIDVESLKQICYLDKVHDYVDNQCHSCSEVDINIQQLKDLCWLESGFLENHFVKMHSLIHSMAIWVRSKGDQRPNFLVKLGDKLETQSNDKGNWEKSDVMSLMMNGLETLPEEPRSEKLQTLLLRKNKMLKRIPENFFQHMSLLQVLDLSHTGISLLPTSLSMLRNLRILLLSRCYNLDDVQSLGDLPKLVHLNLDGTRIKKLPEEMKALTNLQILSLNCTTYLRDIPCNLLSGMINLQKLDMGLSSFNWEDNSSNTHLEELLCLKQLRNLEITFNNIGSLDLMLNSLPKDVLKGLHIVHCKDLAEIQSSHLNNMESLGVLGIYHCPELTRITRIENINKIAFPNLVHLALDGLPKLERIWEGLEGPRSFSNLEILLIDDCHALKSFILLNSMQQLKNLRILTIEDCSAMEEIISGKALQEENPLPKLCSLQISKLPSLKKICDPVLEWVALKHISVKQCPRLKILPFSSSNARIMKIVGEEEWWEGLKWKDANTKATLREKFVPSYLVSDEDVCYGNIFEFFMKIPTMV